MGYTVNTIFMASYDNLKNAIKNVQSQFKSMKTEVARFSQDFKNDMEKAGGSTEILNKAVTSSAVAVASLTVPLTLAGKGALTMAGQFEASTQTLEYTLGKSKKIVDDFVGHNAMSLGMAEQDAYKFANVYSNLITTMTDDQSINATMTNKLLQASAVIMTKTGRTFYDVADRIRSGLLGNTEAIEDLGVNVNVALLETTDAFKQIAGDKSWDTLTFKEQQQVRLLGILEQTSKKYGEEVGENLSLELSKTSAMFQNVKTEASKFLAVGLEPIVEGLKNTLESITVFVKYLNTLDDGTKKTITNFLVFVAVVPTVGLVFSLLMKAINSYLLFTNLASASTVAFTKSMLGLVGSVFLLITGITMLAYAFGIFGNSNKNIKKTTDSTETASKAINNLSTSQNANAKSAKKASEANKELADNLQGFDEINKLQLDTQGSSSLDSVATPTVDLSGIDTSTFDNIDSQVESLNNKVEGFKNRLEELKPVIGAIGAIITGSQLFKIFKGLGTKLKGAKTLIASFTSVLGASGLAGAFDTVAISAMYGAEALTGVSMGVAGSMALMGGLATLIGGTVAAWGYAVYLGFQPAIKTIDVFKDISKETTEELKPFVDTLEDTSRVIKEATFDDIITDEEVERIKSGLNTITNEFNNKFVPKYEKARKQIMDAPITDFMTEEKKQELLNNMEKANTATQMLLEQHKNKILEITERAKNERGYINEEEQKEIDEHMYAITHLTVSRLTENEQEQKTILTRIIQNRERLDATYYAEMLQRAKANKDEQKKLNEQQYEEALESARFLYEDLGSISEEEYNKMIENAKNTYDEMNKKADEGYQEIVNKTKEKMGEAFKTIDEETGKIKNKFQFTWDNITTGISDWWTNSIAPWFTKEKWQEIGTNAVNGLKAEYESFKERFNPIKDWWNDKIAPYFAKERWGEAGKEAIDELGKAFGDFMPKLKTPHLSWSSTPATGWMGNVLSALGLPTSLPKLNVNWYKNGGVFSGESIIGVGEYAGAKSNPEIVAPKSMIYDASIEAIKDSRQNDNYVVNGSNTIKKKIELEVDLKSGGVKFGKQIIDLVLDANDFYDLGLV